MSKFDQQITLYNKSFTEKLNRKDIDSALLSAIARSLGASIYNKDSSKVACSKKDERDRIKNQFLIKKLGLKNNPELDQVILDVCSTMGKTNRNKYRVVFYYLLVEKLKKEGIYLNPTVKTKKEAAAPKLKSTKIANPKVKVENKETEKEKSEDLKIADSDETTTIFKSIGSSEDIINKYALRGALAGLVPVPLIDLAAITGVQFSMIKAIAKNYPHVNFDRKKTKSVLAALMGGVSSFELGIIARILFKGVPFFGPIIAGTAMSGFAYSSTKLIGDIFDEHFATGKDLTIESVTLNKMKDAFRWELGRD
ncbi:MAG: hypothetical protein ACI9FN_000784 [Saprospiraceae bacterium]|jgi:uncharacterized protein (DUF697 family)